MNTSQITFIGATGGAGTSTSCALTALIALESGHSAVEIVTDDVDDMESILGGAPEGISVLSCASGDASFVVVDGGSLRHASRTSYNYRGPKIGVVSGPSYQGARMFSTQTDHMFNGYVIMSEEGRALTQRDFALSIGANVDDMISIPVSPGFARSIDAGLLCAMRGETGVAKKQLAKFLSQF